MCAIINLVCCLNPLNSELNLLCHLLALLGAHYILHISRIRVKYICDLFHIQLSCDKTLDLQNLYVCNVMQWTIFCSKFPNEFIL